MFLAHRSSTHPARKPRLLIRCDRTQIWQRFLAVSGSWTCASYRWHRIRKCTVDVGPHGGGQHRVALLGHVALVTLRHFTRFLIIKTRPVDLRTFAKVAKCRLWRFSKLRGVKLQQLKHISYTNRTSQALQWKLSSLNPEGNYWTARFLALGKQLPNFQMTHVVRICFTSIMF